MKKRIIFVTAVLLPMAAMAIGEKNVFQVANVFSVGYDDNVYSSKNNKQASYFISEGLDLRVNFNTPQTKLSVAYDPYYIYYGNRSPDHDFDHSLNASLRHDFSPKLSLQLNEGFVMSGDPFSAEFGTGQTTQNGQYYYNNISGVLTYEFANETWVDLSGGWTTLRYQDQTLSRVNDYDIYQTSATLRRQLLEKSQGTLTAGYESDQFATADRNSKTVLGSVGVIQTFNPKLIGSLNVGAQYKVFSDNNVGSDTSPYFSGSLSYMPSPDTELRLDVMYSLYYTDYQPYDNQTRTYASLSASHQITHRLQGSLYVNYALGEYSGEQSAAANSPNGHDVTLGGGAKASFMLSRINFLDLSYDFYRYYTSADMARDSYTRNRVALAWRLQF